MPTYRYFLDKNVNTPTYRVQNLNTNEKNTFPYESLEDVELKVKLLNRTATKKEIELGLKNRVELFDIFALSIKSMNDYLRENKKLLLNTPPFTDKGLDLEYNNYYEIILKANDIDRYKKGFEKIINSEFNVLMTKKEVEWYKEHDAEYYYDRFKFNIEDDIGRPIRNNYQPFVIRKIKNKDEYRVSSLLDKDYKAPPPNVMFDPLIGTELFIVKSKNEAEKIVDELYKKFKKDYAVNFDRWLKKAPAAAAPAAAPAPAKKERKKKAPVEAAAPAPAKKERKKKAPVEAPAPAPVSVPKKRGRPKKEPVPEPAPAPVAPMPKKASTFSVRKKRNEKYYNIFDENTGRMLFSFDTKAAALSKVKELEMPKIFSVRKKRNEKYYNIFDENTGRKLFSFDTKAAALSKVKELEKL